MAHMGRPGDKPGNKVNTATTLVHGGRDPAAQMGFVNPPVYRGSTVLFPTLELLRSRQQPYTYGRRQTPTTAALSEAMTALEGGAETILTASGLQAVTTALLAFVQSGDHILMTDSVYQPTRAFCDGLLRSLGVETTYYDPLLGGGIASLFKANTRLVFTESPGSLTFEIQDLDAIATAARARDIWVLTDNTWASPLFFAPLAHGADVSIHAGTKYIVGHADALLGTVTSNARAARYLNRAKEMLGTSPGSEESWLALRGLRTLDARLERHQRSALDIAAWLENRDEVARVLHPGLPSHPQHELWRRQFCGSTGLFTAILQPASETALAAMLDQLRYFGMGYSWGGFESLVIPFEAASIRTATHWHADGPTLRFHIGLEAVDDLKADLDAGFARLRAAA